MISYSTNFMGPISLDWFRQRGLTVKETRWSDILKKDITVTKITQNWMGGRIDVYGTDNLYGEEIALPIMHDSDWYKFSNWLNNYKTDCVKTLDEILESYYNDGNDKIRWWSGKMQRYDIVIYRDHATIEPHFCREWDEDGGCYGTNPNHGFSFDEACDEVAEWYEQQAKLWRNRTHYMLDRYRD